MKLTVQTFLTLDGVMQAPGGPEEDPTGGFTFGGWTFNYWDEAMGRSMSGFDGKNFINGEFVTPAGTSHAIDYSGPDAPAVEVRVQHDSVARPAGAEDGAEHGVASRSDLEAGTLEGGGAGAGALLGNARQEGEQEVLELGVVLLEHPHDLGVAHRLDPGHALQADVVVGDQRDVHVAELELAGEQGLGVAGHVDDLPAVALEPAGLGPGREAGALDDHHGAAVVGGDALGLRLLESEGAQLVIGASDTPTIDDSFMGVR